jgi:hypothetical protein
MLRGEIGAISYCRHALHGVQGLAVALLSHCAHLPLLPVRSTPNVPRLWSAHTSENCFHLLMEWFPGGNFLERLQAGTSPATESELAVAVCAMMHDVASASPLTQPPLRQAPKAAAPKEPLLLLSPRRLLSHCCARSPPCTLLVYLIVMSNWKTCLQTPLGMLCWVTTTSLCLRTSRVHVHLSAPSCE